MFFINLFLIKHNNITLSTQQRMQKPKKVIQTTLTIYSRQNKSGQKQKQQDVNSDLSKNSQSQNRDNRQQNKKQLPPMHNVEFYRNKRVSQPSGDFILNIHKNWCDNFQLLERHHGFIQWLFPNSFTSRFNSKSHALSKQEQNIFRTDMTIAERYVHSYQMMLQFYGMKLKSKKTGQITQARLINYKQRYRATFLTSFHNHMRITRILCSLAMIGFGRYAKQLSLFLNNEIHSQKGELRALSKYNVDRDWKQYQNYVQTYDDLNVFLRQYEKREEHEKDLNKKLVTEDQKSEQKIDLKIVEKVDKQKNEKS